MLGLSGLEKTWCCFRFEAILAWPGSLQASHSDWQCSWGCAVSVPEGCGVSEGVSAISWEMLLQPLSCAIQPELSPQQWAAFEPSGPALHSQEKNGIPNQESKGVCLPDFSLHRIVQLSCCLQMKSFLGMAFGLTACSWQQLGTHSLFS